MRGVTISLPDPLRRFVDDQIAQGRYGSVSEYVGELIRADAKRAAKAGLEALLLEGPRGEATAFTGDDWRAIRQEAEAQVKKAGMSLA